jgi:hypothetical protein
MPWFVATAEQPTLIKSHHAQDILNSVRAPALAVPQVVTQYSDRDVAHVLEACERMEAHLTAAVVSNDVRFVQHILGSTVNGTTYAGIRARTTGGLAMGCVSGCLRQRGWAADVRASA